MLVQVVEGKSKVNARRSSDDQLLAGAVEALCYIANLEFPDERGEGFGGPANVNFWTEVRRRTAEYWPGLWAGKRGDLSPTVIVRKMREYLQRFWREQDKRARDWYIHRAREYHQEKRVLADEQMRNLRKLMHSAKTPADLALLWNEHDGRKERLLDEPPPRTLFEDALFELQERARWSSKSPLYCKNPNCRTTPGHRGPFFLSEKKGTKYCCEECSRAGVLASKKKSWATHKQDWRKK